jgi:restriction system protein
MPIPDFQTLMLPVLKLFAAGAESVSDCFPDLITQFSITEEEASQLIPSGRLTILQSRAHWARTYLSKAGLLESPRRNRHRITEVGRRLLATNPARVDMRSLEAFPEFTEWRDQAKGADRPISLIESPTLADTQTPEDQMDSAAAVLESALREELLLLLQDMHPVRFERLILDLLAAMGYGAGDLANTHMTKASGDGGIDGVIHEDALGLDAVYIQAKRYAPGSNVGRPAIQQFVGSLTGEGATKGVFVTTSDFSSDARAYLSRVQHRVILINGQELARLMVRHGVGVRTRATYLIKGVDADYFDDLKTV